MVKKPKCEDIGFEHAWEQPKIHGAVDHAGMPLRRESKRYCLNCDKPQHLVFVGMAKGPPGVPDVAVYEWKDDV